MDLMNNMVTQMNNNGNTFGQQQHSMQEAGIVQQRQSVFGNVGGQPYSFL